MIQIRSQGQSCLNDSKHSNPKTFAFAFGLRLRSKTRRSKTCVLGRRAQRRDCELGLCVIKCQLSKIVLWLFLEISRLAGQISQLEAESRKGARIGLGFLYRKGPLKPYAVQLTNRRTKAFPYISESTFGSLAPLTCGTNWNIFRNSMGLACVKARSLQCGFWLRRSQILIWHAAVTCCGFLGVFFASAFFLRKKGPNAIHQEISKAHVSAEWNCGRFFWWLWRVLRWIFRPRRTDFATDFVADFCFLSKRRIFPKTGKRAKIIWGWNPLEIHDRNPRGAPGETCFPKISCKKHPVFCSDEFPWISAEAFLLTVCAPSSRGARSSNARHVMPQFSRAFSPLSLYSLKKGQWERFSTCLHVRKNTPFMACIIQSQEENIAKCNPPPPTRQNFYY